MANYGVPMLVLKGKKWWATEIERGRQKHIETGRGKCRQRQIQIKTEMETAIDRDTQADRH